MEKLVLVNPIEVNGKKVTEVTYDANEITAISFVEAEARRKTTAGIKNVSLTISAEFDFGLHLYLGFAAILAVNPQYDYADMERIKGADVKKVMDIGRNFILMSEESAESNSGEQSEIMDDTTTQA